MSNPIVNNFTPNSRKGQLKQSWMFPPTLLNNIFILLLAIGVFFRFVNLGKKVYWTDEALTSLRISGYSNAELVEQAFNGRIITAKELQNYQKISPARNLNDTFDALAKSPEHPPLYYLLARFWVQWFGDSAAMTRSLSAVISLLVFPSVYWLCLELFESPLVGWMAIALIAVSPFHILYAQEAREYSLWTVTILLSSAALLRAMRLRTTLSWALYALTIVLSLYTCLLSILVTIGQGIYVILIERFRPSKVLISYFIASILGLIIFTPWLLVGSTKGSGLQKAADLLAKNLGLLSWLKIFSLNLVRLFWDVEFASGSWLMYVTLPIIILVLTLIGYSIYFLCQGSSMRIWLFPITLITVPFLGMILLDLVLGARLSSLSRYLIPTYLGIQLSISYLLATNLISTFIKNWQKKLWRVVTVLLVSSSLLSSAVSSQSELWWNKYTSQHNLQVARIINQAKSPLAISDSSVGNPLSLSRLLKPEVRLQLSTNSDDIKVPEAFSEIFLFNPSKTLLSRLKKEKKYRIKSVASQDSMHLYRLER